ncbi:GLIPR1-like protein 1 [Physella acuta]|uniref:GLIPR1-like protein 1 n=1 Tax=Physella acuta TaxID=109671 RepID=UPI0027DAD3A1|nr:GLIPR1-like protein 1 [Physella acuta]
MKAILFSLVSLSIVQASRTVTLLNDDINASLKAHNNARVVARAPALSLKFVYGFIKVFQATECTTSIYLYVASHSKLAMPATMKSIQLFLAILAVAYAGVSVPLTTANIDAFLKSHKDVRAALKIPSLDITLLDASIASLPSTDPYKNSADSEAEKNVWNTTLANYAKNWTAQCAFKHSYGPYGENLYMSSPLSSNATDIAYKSASAWKSELVNVVDFTKWSCITTSPTCGHYSQMVWKKSTSVGCAFTQCVNVTGAMPNLVSCNYYPRGNYIGQLPY